jgi:hypothetical protein
VVPAALGGTLETDRVCRACNERAGSEIDWGLQNDWLIAQTKILHGVVNSRKGATGKGRTGRSEAHRSGDPETHVEIDRNWKPTVRGGIDRFEGGARISASSEAEAKRLRDRLVKQLAADGLKIEGEELSRDQFNEVDIKVSLDGVVWLRAAAKMALASLSLCLDDTWLDGDDAKRLRRWLWDQEPTLDDGSPAFAHPNEPNVAEALVAPPPTHLITMGSTPSSDKRVVVSIGLFGGLYLRVGVETGPPLPDSCWVIVPGDPPRELTWRLFFDEATRRFIQQNEQEASPEEP